MVMARKKRKAMMKKSISTVFTVCVVFLASCTIGKDVAFPLGSRIKITNKDDKECYDAIFNDLDGDIEIAFFKIKSNLKKNRLYKITRFERMVRKSIIIAVPKVGSAAMILTENMGAMNTIIQSEKLDVNEMTDAQIAGLVKEAIRLTASPRQYMEVVDSLKELEYKKSEPDLKRKAEAERLLGKVIKPMKITKGNDGAMAILYLVKYEDIVKRTVNIKKDGTLEFTDEVIGKRLAPTRRGFL